MSDLKVVYSFDVFDTLIGRVTFSPLGIFMLMESYLLQNKQFDDFPQRVKASFFETRIRAQKAAVVIFKGRELKLEDIYETYGRMTGMDRNQCDRLMNLELEVERKSCFLLPENIKMLKEIREKGHEVILISDMYLSGDQIKDILCFLDSAFKNVEIFVSSDLSASKRSGRLFVEVKKEKNLVYQNWHHIGDHPYSDVLMPHFLGIDALQAGGQEEPEWIKQISESQALKSDLSAQLILGCTHNYLRKQDCSLPFLVGMLIATPILLAYVDWLIDMCHRLKIKTLYFIARDGYILKRIFDLYYDGEGIEARYLYGSRRAWRVSDPEKRRRVRNYLRQEIDFRDDTWALVDLSGSGKSIEYLAEICEKKFKVFYFEFIKKCNPELVQAFAFHYAINKSVLEALCRAPEGATTGYELENDRWKPLLEENGKKIWEESHLPEYLDGIESCVKYLKKVTGDFQIRLNLDTTKNFFIEYVAFFPDRKVAEFVGDIFHSGKMEGESRYAPALHTYDMDLRLQGQSFYTGSDLKYSLLRTESSVIEYYQSRLDSLWKESMKKNRENLKSRDIAQPKLVLYGAGENGEKVMIRIVADGRFSIVAWVDIRYEELQGKGVPVCSIEAIDDEEYDYIVITILNRTEDVRLLLQERGIAAEKIITSSQLTDLFSGKEE